MEATGEPQLTEVNSEKKMRKRTGLLDCNS
jgi:hypothetical protein